LAELEEARLNLVDVVRLLRREGIPYNADAVQRLAVQLDLRISQTAPVNP
jgi:hypothetical protein